MNRLKWILAFMACALTLRAGAVEFEVVDSPNRITISTANYKMEIQRPGFCFGFKDASGKEIAPPHAKSGLEFGGCIALHSELRSHDKRRVMVDVINELGEVAHVEIEPAEHRVRMGMTASKSGPVVFRTGGMSPAFGLGDLGVRHRSTTELTGFTNENFHADGGQCGRLISNFAIFPKQGFAEINIEPRTKIVRLTAEENAQGSRNAAAVPGMYYFFGTPEQIYAGFLEVRNKEGYRVYKPKPEWFGVGWEAWGALAWDTNEKTVTDNILRYLQMGYPLSWMVVGSGFWPRGETNMLATTSFGMWDTNLYPHPKEFLKKFHDLGLKCFIGLRIAFITNGPFAGEGLKGDYFLKEDGAAKAFKIGFPKSPCYLLDAQNPAAVKWYIGLCHKWMDYGVDGFKEDLFGYQKYLLRDDKIDPVNAALMDQGVYVMGRNGYLGSPMDIHRFEDFNFDQNQDRGPINGLAFAYSGHPFVYPDIIGGTFAEGRKMPPFSDPKLHYYIMRNAQYASVNPAMAMGIGPWKFESQLVERVMLAAAQLHARLQPYIYSAALETVETGYPWTMTPLPIAWPNDPEVYELENATRRGYEWMLGPSLLATPVYGNDYATAETRDVYLPAGDWEDYDSGKIYKGPITLKGFALPPGKTPLFVGGKGVVVTRDLKSHALYAAVYPVAPRDSKYRFRDADGITQSEIRSRHDGWNIPSLVVVDAKETRKVMFESDEGTACIRFKITPGHDYEITGGGK